MTDFHTHILSGIDDGAKNIDESLQLLEILKEAEVKNVVLTPHYYSFEQSIDTFLENRNYAYNKLLEVYHQDINLVLAAEVYFSEKVSNDENINKLKIGNTNFMLVELENELDFEKIYDRLYNLIYIDNVNPIIAHVERYSLLRKKPKLIAELIELGCLIQTNINSLADNNSGFIRKLIKSNMVHLIGSDCHNLKNRKPDYNTFYKKIQKYKLTEFLKQVEDYSESILNDIKPGIKPFI